MRPWTECRFLPYPSPDRTLLEVRDLTVCYGGMDERRPVLSHLNFDIEAGEILGLQGRSGSGKTSTALALLKLLPRGALTSGSVLFRGRNLLELPDSELRALRGKEISIIYQEPALALNPVIRVGHQIAEVMRAHNSLSSRECRHRAAEMLEKVHLVSSSYYDRYPHELSGGECHRIVLAQALVCRPSLVIADEPTAGLDPTLKNEVLTLVGELRREIGSAFLLISHDRSVIERMANRTIDLSADTPAKTVAATTHGFWRESTVPAQSKSEQLISVRNLSKWYQTRGLFRRRSTEKHALDSVDLTIPKGALVALVGPSGSGKSTLARCLALLETADCGEIQYDQKNLLALKRCELRQYRPRLQYISQDPAAALNPRLSAAEAVEEPLLIRNFAIAQDRRKRVQCLMEQVGLDSTMANRSCHQLSGGQKQRLVIARALALEPRLLIFDESLSGLDRETQQEILALLGNLRQKLAISQLLISHDLQLVSAIADSIAVMQDGRIIEHESTLKIANDPQHWSTEHVMQAVPRQELVLTEAE